MSGIAAIEWARRVTLRQCTADVTRTHQEVKASGSSGARGHIISYPEAKTKLVQSSIYGGVEISIRDL